MIKTFRHKGIETFFLTGKKAGIQPAHAGHYSLKVSGNWRMTFAFEGENAVLVDYQDYH
jgi:proteic killer suppression protein